jgi:hypothetical protein
VGLAQQSWPSFWLGSFLARRQPPERWLIDLSAGDDRLLAPQRYRTVPNPEDRLFIPEEYVPLFEQNGWKPTN